MHLDVTVKRRLIKQIYAANSHLRAVSGLGLSARSAYAEVAPSWIGVTTYENLIAPVLSTVCLRIGT